MYYKSVEEVINNAYGLEDDGEYTKALEVWNSGFDCFTEEELKEYEFDIYCGRIWIHYMMKNSESFINNIIEAVENEIICPQWMFEYKGNEDYELFLKLWQDDYRYRKTKEKNDLLRVERQKITKFKYNIYFPKEYDCNKKYPLFIAMHGDGDNIKSFIKEWKTEMFLSRGYIVVYAQSSQVYNHKGYSWISNLDIARNDISRLYKELKRQYFINEECVILGGFSGGAVAAIDIVMEGVIPIKGLIAICPERKPNSVTISSIKDALCRKVKLVFMEGENSLPVKAQEEMLEMFKNSGLPCKYYINKGLEHEIPNDLDYKLDGILDFIYNEDANEKI